MKAKHVQFSSVQLQLDVDSPLKNPPLPRPVEDITHVGGKLFAIRIPGGMKSGKSAVILHIDLDDGSTLLLEMSLGLLNTIPVAFHARDEVEGRPSSR
jgi:hypothetical protein